MFDKFTSSDEAGKRLCSKKKVSQVSWHLLLLTLCDSHYYNDAKQQFFVVTLARVRGSV